LSMVTLLFQMTKPINIIVYGNWIFMFLERQSQCHWLKMHIKTTSNTALRKQNHKEKI
jgi:hypothetical protein